MIEITPELLNALPKEVVAYLDWQERWADTARPNQIIPEGGWSEYGVMAGRGFGKTRVGAEWLGKSVHERAGGLPAYVVAPTQADVRFTCFEGESGLLSIIPPDLVVQYNASDLILKLHCQDGSVSSIRGFSAEKGDRLRGPQGAFAWCDEVAAWGAQAQPTWDNMMMGLRLGDAPQVLWTSTPRATAFVRALTADKAGRVIVRGTTFDNRANLPKSFFDQLEQYEGTKLGRQELYGELIDPEESGIIRRSWFNLWPKDKPLPSLDYIVMSLDTAYTEATYDKKTGDADPTACVVLGLFHVKTVAHVIVLDCWEDHLGLPDLIRRVKRERETRYGDDEDVALIKPLFGSAKPVTSGRKADMLLIEDKGSGISLRQMLAQSGIEAYAYNPGRADKLARLHIVSPIFAQRRVWLPESAKLPGKPRTWCDPLVSQLCSFTGEGSTQHDDFVDATTQALRVLTDQGLMSMTKPTRDEKRLAEYEEATASEPRENPYAA